MRKITDHVANPVNDKLEIEVLDAPGAGGANHRYRISGFNDREGERLSPLLQGSTYVHFQNGPINEAGVNGVTQEALLAIVIDRLRCFQAGPFACVENQEALGYAQASLDALKKRTLDRMARNVEGRNVA